MPVWWREVMWIDSPVRLGRDPPCASEHDLLFAHASRPPRWPGRLTASRHRFWRHLATARLEVTASINSRTCSLVMSPATFSSPPVGGRRGRVFRSTPGRTRRPRPAGPRRRGGRCHARWRRPSHADSRKAMLRENPCEEIQGAATGEGQTEKLQARAERLP